ncbi:hypothetical protein PS943_02725 [Pseudomonas fluorescens]|uniref:DUF3916 domain-containing protein n=1 Tax=Pseudomonas fluorescens TaxID=294 RepID=A0A5E7WAN9_PSEFL|nr:DUF3916 domain-containing protein [Pseudomonas fluorescens]VVQ32152.1 hypothetical protein PS943_02725 [Pseudomonas fluorescens]
MTMRRLALSNKKVRNIPRRLKALAAWTSRFEGYFPDDLTLEQKYSNWKIPVLTTLVEGKQATAAIRKECAQQMINAAHNMLQARPENAIDCRVVAVICLPEMFSSEICIYTDLEYHRGHIPSFGDEHHRTDKSLATEWGLILPEGMKERGLRYTAEDCDEQPYEAERWYFGEVD